MEKILRECVRRANKESLDPGATLMETLDYLKKELSDREKADTAKHRKDKSIVITRMRKLEIQIGSKWGSEGKLNKELRLNPSNAGLKQRIDRLHN